MISPGVRKAASSAASGLRHTRGFWTYLLHPQCETENRAVCPRSLLLPAGLWSTNGGMLNAFERAILRKRTQGGVWRSKSPRSWSLGLFCRSSRQSQARSSRGLFERRFPPGFKSQALGTGGRFGGDQQVQRAGDRVNFGSAQDSELTRICRSLSEAGDLRGV
jgi:hypothetical protein